MNLTIVRLLGALLAATVVTSCATKLDSPATAPAVDYQRAVDELLAADRAFAAASAGRELADGIAAMSDGETVMPAPGGFVRGTAAILAALKNNPANLGATATWSPVRGGIAASGDHGFTIGFMTIKADGKPDRKAKYVSYWVKRPSGWRLAVYKRAGQPDGPFSLDLMPASLPVRALPRAQDPALLDSYRLSLDRAERGFSDDAQTMGIGPAFVKHGRPDATNIGNGPGFTVGNEKIGADVGAGSSDGGGVRWAPDGGVIVASTGDLGITWGYIRPNGPPRAGQPGEFPYTTIWRRDSPEEPWRYVAE